MDAFNFVFSLFSILLGLALAEVLGGLGKALQSRHKVRVGWLTPMLGAIIALDVTSYWSVAWDMRSHTPPRFFVMIGILILTSIYYLIARLSFPGDPNEWPDYDRYFWAHKKLVLGGLLVCNIISTAGEAALGYNPVGTTYLSIVGLVFFPLVAAAILVKGKALNTVLMAVIILQYPAFSLYYLLTNG